VFSRRKGRIGLGLVFSRRKGRIGIGLGTRIARRHTNKKKSFEKNVYVYISYTFHILESSKGIPVDLFRLYNLGLYQLVEYVQGF
jgi:hypothetical protein